MLDLKISFVEAANWEDRCVKLEALLLEDRYEAAPQYCGSDSDNRSLLVQLAGAQLVVQGR